MLLHCSSDLPDGWEFQEIRTLEQIEAIRSLWQDMHSAESRPVLESDIDRYVSVLKASKETKPYVLVLRQNNQPRAMVVGRLGTEKLPLRFGYKTIMKPTIKCLSIIYGGVLGQPDEQVSSMVIRGLMGILRQGEMGGIGFNHLRIDSPFYQQIRRITPFLCRNHFPVIDFHGRMLLPENMDAFFQKLPKKHRANLRRTIRNFKDTYQHSIKLVESGEDMDIDCMSCDVEKISIKTYQNALNASFSKNSLTQSILETDTKLGRLKMSILYIADQPCAFQWGTVIKNTYFMERVGYDPQWSQQGIGNILFINNLEQLCSDCARKYIDFGFGDAHYKRSYANESWLEAKATYLFAPRLYPLFINSLISLNGAFTIGMTWVVRKLGIYAWIKRIWRKKLKKVAMYNKQES